jgi:DNA-binding GntR family transcriptional regulator
LTQLASGVKLTRRAIQEQFNVSDRTAKRYLGELAEAELIEFDRSEHPGFYRLR